MDNGQPTPARSPCKKKKGKAILRIEKKYKKKGSREQKKPWEKGRKTNVPFVYTQI